MVGAQECRTPGRGLAWPAGPASDRARAEGASPKRQAGASAALGCEGSTETQLCAGLQNRLQGRFHRLKMDLEC